VVEPRRERVELRLPVLAVAIEPDRGGKDRPGVEPAAADAAGALLRHETGAHEHLDVPRHGLQRDVERRRQFGNQPILPVERGQQGAPHRIGKRPENLVEDGAFGVGGGVDRNGGGGGRG